MADFLDQFLAGKKKRKQGPESKLTIRQDRWDRAEAEAVAAEVKEYTIARDQLSGAVETGEEAMHDTLLSLFKALPQLKPASEIRPSFLVNRTVMDAMTDLKEYKRQRGMTMGDRIAAGLACHAMEPELEILFDKLRKAQELANSLDASVSEAEALQEELDDLLERLEQQLQDSDEEDEEVKNFQDQVEAIEEAMEALRQQIAEQEADLQAELDMQGPYVRSQLKEALEEANEQGEVLEQFESWGLQPGALRRMNPEARIAMAAKLRTAKFKRMADMIGRMQNVATEEQMQRVDYACDEIYDIEQGADLARVLPTELLALDDDMLVLEFLHRYAERSLAQYSLHGVDSVVKGGILFLEDGSGSMSGDREIWSKAVGLALLKIAVMQQRPFYAINFSGPGTYVDWEFDTSNKDYLKSKKDYRGSSAEFEGPEAVMDFAETTLHGGPLRVDQRVLTPNGWIPIGQIKVGDQVYGTDGKPCNVVGVFPQGELELVKITFTDGSEVICDRSHRFNFVNATGDTVTMTVSALMGSVVWSELRLPPISADYHGQSDGNVTCDAYTEKYVTAIVPVDPGAAVCIAVDSEDHLYLTEGYTPTHNTDFVTPFSVALTRMQREFEERGAVEGDIVFATDGECGVPESFITDFKAEQERLGFKVYGIAIGCNPRSEPLWTLCDHQVIGVKSLTDPSDMRPLFGKIG